MLVVASIHQVVNNSSLLQLTRFAKPLELFINVCKCAQHIFITPTKAHKYVFFLHKFD
jgi:hypothetical protein